VTKIGKAEVTEKLQEMYGGSGERASAYMLQYRRYDPKNKEYDENDENP